MTDNDFDILKSFWSKYKKQVINFTKYISEWNLEDQKLKTQNQLYSKLVKIFSSSARFEYLCRVNNRSLLLIGMNIDPDHEIRRWIVEKLNDKTLWALFLKDKHYNNRLHAALILNQLWVWKELLLDKHEKNRELAITKLLLHPNCKTEEKKEIINVIRNDPFTTNHTHMLVNRLLDSADWYEGSRECICFNEADKNVNCEPCFQICNDLFSIDSYNELSHIVSAIRILFEKQYCYIQDDLELKSEDFEEIQKYSNAVIKNLDNTDYGLHKDIYNAFSSLNVNLSELMNQKGFM